MIQTRFDDRFREALGPSAVANREAALRFATEFARLLIWFLPDQLSPQATQAVQDQLAARTQLAPSEIEVLLELALAPEYRTAISEDELRAYGARFGHAEEEALRAAVQEELDLAGFAEHYGTGEALLLLDALFAVCAAGERIAPGNIGRLQQAATQLGIDPMLVSALFRKHDVRHAAGDFVFELRPSHRYVVGRANAAGIQLPDPQVAPQHVELVHTTQGWQAIDLASARPTLLNGAPIRTAPFRPKDQLKVGPYTLQLGRDGQTLAAFGLKAFSALSVRNVSYQVGQTSLLDGVSFTAFSGEVIAVVGPSGAGKTTLLNTLAGSIHPNAGEIFLDGADFHAMLANDKSIAGVVPQNSVVHSELTVQESLYYAAKLRFRADVSNAAIWARVNNVLGELGIYTIRNHRIGSSLRRGISGGQLKRVNLGHELLTQTTKVLFLDEPTSGLDPCAAQGIVSQVRQLADNGRIVFMATHDVRPSILSMVDHLVVLAPGGRLAWFGPPQEACTWFGVSTFQDLFARLETLPHQGLQQRFREGPAYRKFVRTREHLIGLDGVKHTEASHEKPLKSPFFLQYSTLTRRSFKVKRRDYMGTGVLLAQAPVLGFAMWVVFPHPDVATLFMLVLSVLWFGASAAVRELIAERTIWRREARVGLGVYPYMASKLTVLGTLVAFQCVTLTTIAYVGLAMHDYGFHMGYLNAVSLATGLTGMAMGLLVSAVVSSSEAAIGALPLLLIPQITFGGLIVNLKDMAPLAKAMAYTMMVRYSFEASIKTGEQLSKPTYKGIVQRPEDIRRFLWELGFRSSDANDMGLSMTTLMGVLFAFFVVFIALATWLTSRSREGN